MIKKRGKINPRKQVIKEFNIVNFISLVTSG